MNKYLWCAAGVVAVAAVTWWISSDDEPKQKAEQTMDSQADITLNEIDVDRVAKASDIKATFSAINIVLRNHATDDRNAVVILKQLLIELMHKRYSSWAADKPDLISSFMFLFIDYRDNRDLDRLLKSQVAKHHNLKDVEVEAAVAFFKAA